MQAQYSVQTIVAHVVNRVGPPSGRSHGQWVLGCSVTQAFRACLAPRPPGVQPLSGRLVKGVWGGGALQLEPYVYDIVFLLLFKP